MAASQKLHQALDAAYDKRHVKKVASDAEVAAEQAAADAQNKADQAKQTAAAASTDATKAEQDFMDLFRSDFESAEQDEPAADEPAPEKKPAADATSSAAVVVDQAAKTP